MRSSALLLVVAFATLITLFAAPRPAAACSCAFIELAQAANDPQFAVFVGTLGGLVGDVLPVRVEAWYHGQGAAPVVEVEGWFSELGGGADCSIPPPERGATLVMATYRAPETGRYAMHLCTRQAPLNSPEGRDLLAEARAVFGPPAVPSPGPAEGATGGSFEIPAWAPIAGLVIVIAAGSALAFLGAERRRKTS
jgi:hypothetical protein